MISLVQAKIEMMDTLVSSNGEISSVTDLASAEIMADTIKAIVGTPPDVGEKSDIGIELVKKAGALIQVQTIPVLSEFSFQSSIFPFSFQQLMKKVSEMSVDNADSIIPMIETLMETMGILLQVTSGRLIYDQK